MDKSNTLYMIVDVEYDERSVPMYRVYYIEKDTRLSLYVSIFDNPNLVKWLTPLRQNPVAQPPKRQNDDVIEA